MPLYEYQCDKCAHRFEVIQKFSDPPIDVCPKCAGQVKKLLSSPAIQFKGTGWYITDYSAKGKSNPDTSSSKDQTKKTDTGSSDSSAKADSAGATTTAPKPSTET